MGLLYIVSITLVIGYVLGWSTSSWLQKNKLNANEEILKLQEKEIKYRDNKIEDLKGELVVLTEKLVPLTEEELVVEPFIPSELHHVSLPANNLEISIEFYKDMLGLVQIERPDYIENNISLKGVWFQLKSGQQLHLFDNPNGTFRNGSFEFRDCHFALRVKDFVTTCERLRKKGANIIDSPFYTSRYSNIYLLDPDNHIIEINA